MKPSLRSAPPAAEMFLAAFFTASMAAVAHGVRTELAWQVMAFWRILTTFLVALAMARVLRIPLVLIGAPIMWVRSVAGSVGLLCMFYSFTHMPITDALAIQHTSPLWVAIILALYARRLPGPMTWLSVVLGLAGVLLLERPTFDATGFAMLVAFAGAWGLAVATVSLRFLGAESPITVIAHACGFSTIACAVAWLLAPDGIDSSIAVESAGWIVLIGLLGTIAQFLMTHAIGRGDTQLLALIALSTIGFAAVYDLAFWGVAINTLEIIGIGCIIASVIVCSRRPREILIQPTSAQTKSERRAASDSISA